MLALLLVPLQLLLPQFLQFAFLLRIESQLALFVALCAQLQL